MRFLAALVSEAISLTSAHEGHKVSDAWKYRDELIRAWIFHRTSASLIHEEKQESGPEEVASRDSWQLIGCRHSGDIFQTALRTCLHNYQLVRLILSNTSSQWWMKRNRALGEGTAKYLSESRNGQMSGTGGVGGLSLARAMMCSKVMSVWVLAFMSCTSGAAP